MIRYGLELPDPFELVVKGSEHLVGYACHKCGAAFLVHKRKDPALYEAERKHQREQAAEHCVKACPCGQLIERSYHLRCNACYAQMEADKEKARFEKAKKLTIEEYDGPVYWDGHSGDIGDGYFSDVEALLDYCEQEGRDVPEYAWACDKEEMKLNADGIVENATSNMFEDAYDHVPNKDIVSLQAYLDVWCKEVGLVTWSDDHGRAVLLREPEAPALTG